MSACRFRVASLAVEPDLRSHPMRLVTLTALESEPFTPDSAIKGAAPAPPVGLISMLVSPSYAKRFSVGDEFDVIFRERSHG